MSRILLACLLGFCACVRAQDFDPSRLAQAQGTYRFEDGTCITGGRMDEGTVRLLYMDVWHNRLGVLAQPDGDALRVLAPPGSTLRLDDDGASLVLTGAGGQVRSATRLGAPEAREVRFRSGPLMLAGTLYLPPGDAALRPAVVLAHGSGPVDRFGGPWTTFFTDLGFAVLSYDKRGVGASQGDWRQASYEDLAGDLQAAVDWLAEQPGIDPARMGIHATSQSGWYAPLAAAREPRVRFLIQRAAPALWTGPVTAHENANDWRAEGVPESDIARASTFWLRLHRLARRGGTVADAQALIDGAVDEAWFTATFGEGWRQVDGDAWRRRQANARLDPARTAGILGIPVLWFLAENDENVPYAASQRALKDAARTNGRISVVTVQDAPHSFLIKQPDGSVRYTDQYWAGMADWLSAHGLAGTAQHACTGARADAGT